MPTTPRKRAGKPAPPAAGRILNSPRGRVAASRRAAAGKKAYAAQYAESDESASDNASDYDDDAAATAAASAPAPAPAAPRSAVEEHERQQRRAEALEDRSRRRRSGAAMHHPPHHHHHQTVESSQTKPPPLTATVSAEEMARKYEEWMKIAADNKINANNSWNLALIDYFHDMTILRDGDSVNFQRASCTLDGCVKIYTSRVDHVDAETRKLLNGLAERRSMADEDGLEGDDGETVKKKRAHRSGNTLEKDFNALNLKKFDLEFAVDPLFKKTSADFDEGGARGLLLNHLNIHDNGKLIFDASDVAPTAPAAKDGEQNGDDDASKKVDEDALQDDVVPLDKIISLFGHLLAELHTRDVCPSLKSFSFASSSANTADLFDPRLLENLAAAAAASGNADDFDDDLADRFRDFGGIGDDGDDNDDFGSGLGIDDIDGSSPAPEGDGVGVSTSQQQYDQMSGGLVGIAGGAKIDPRFVETMRQDDDDLFEYFDSHMLRNWAGPEHVRLRPLRVREREAKNQQQQQQQQQQQHGEGSGARGGSSRKEVAAIDFVNGTTITDRDLFLPSATPASLALKLDKSKGRNVLPEDTRFSSRDMLALFLKPRVTARFFKSAGGRIEEAKRDAPLDEEFWAEHNNDQPVFVDESTPVDASALSGVAGAGADGVNDTHVNVDQAIFPEDFDDMDDDDDFGGLADDAGSSGGAVGLFGAPLATQDDEASQLSMSQDPLQSQVSDAGASAMDDSMLDYASQLVAAPKRVKAVHLNYARTAKRVDVRRLKENIWKELVVDDLPPIESLSPPPEPNVPPVDPEAVPAPEEAKVAGEHKFTSLVTGLRRFYPERKLRDISVPFCFICLLHLANEQNLAIESDGSLTELVVRQNEGIQAA